MTSVLTCILTSDQDVKRCLLRMSSRRKQCLRICIHQSEQHLVPHRCVKIHGLSLTECIQWKRIIAVAFASAFRLRVQYQLNNLGTEFLISFCHEELMKRRRLECFVAHAKAGRGSGRLFLKKMQQLVPFLFAA